MSLFMYNCICYQKLNFFIHLFLIKNWWLSVTEASVDNSPAAMTRLTFLVVVSLTLAFTLAISLAEARPVEGGEDSPAVPPLPGNINGGDSNDCPPGYVWDSWRQDCVRYFG